MKNTIKNHILNIVYPENITCINCDVDLDENTNHRYGLCSSCLLGIDWIKGRTCQSCGGPLADFHNNNICYNCEKVKSSLVSNAACFGYSGVGKDLIMDLKYNNKTYLGKHFAEMIADLISTTIIEEIDMIVSVPLHKKRFNERGYNQMDVVGQPLSKIVNIPYESTALQRLRNTPRLKNLDRMERKATTDALFKANPNVVAGKRVLLIDDIYTTGTTMNACARALLSENALLVYGIVLSVNFRD